MIGYKEIDNNKDLLLWLTRFYFWKKLKHIQYLAMPIEMNSFSWFSSISVLVGKFVK